MHRKVLPIDILVHYSGPDTSYGKYFSHISVIFFCRAVISQLINSRIVPFWIKIMLFEQLIRLRIHA